MCARSKMTVFPSNRSGEALTVNIDGPVAAASAGGGPAAGGVVIGPVIGVVIGCGVGGGGAAGRAGVVSFGGAAGGAVGRDFGLVNSTRYGLAGWVWTVVPPAT